MRTTFDRIRQAVSFELIGLLIAAPVGAWLFEFGTSDFGVLVFLGATLATGWNYVYNLVFDHALKRLRGRASKTLPLRVVHALGFEAGLMLGFLPVTAWWLGVGLLEALTIDLAFSAFYLVYAFVFTWGYETLYPVEA